MGASRWVRGWIIAVAAAGAAGATMAQADGGLRWRTGVLPLGLQASAKEFLVPCSARSIACDTRAVMPLYTSAVSPRSLSMQVDVVDHPPVLKAARPQGLSLSFLGRPGLPWELGVYGRIGTTWARANGGMPEGGVSYGVGLSWDFSRSASAVLGFDSMDVRSPGGEAREVRSTSLGLQIRY